MQGMKNRSVLWRSTVYIASILCASVSLGGGKYHAGEYCTLKLVWKKERIYYYDNVVAERERCSVLISLCLDLILLLVTIFSTHTVPPVSRSQSIFCEGSCLIALYRLGWRRCGQKPSTALGCSSRVVKLSHYSSEDTRVKPCSEAVLKDAALIRMWTYI